MTAKTARTLWNIHPLKMWYFQLKRKKQLAGWSSLGSTCEWNVSRLQYNTAASNTLPLSLSLPHFNSTTNLNEMCCCEDSRGRWPLSRSKHLSEIGWNWYNPGHGIITPAWDCHETPSVFMLPISLGLGVCSSCLFFFLFQRRLFYLVPLLDLDRLPPETELSLWGLWRRLVIEAHWCTAPSVATCACMQMGVRAHTQAEDIIYRFSYVHKPTPIVKRRCQWESENNWSAGSLVLSVSVETAPR